jgi:predicted membrane chloride channel (bestrophin family)
VPGERDDVLRALLPESEASWVAAQRSRPLVLLGALRRELHKQWEVGNLPPHLHRKLDEDVRELDLVVGGCERLFSSPVPPTMSRHTLRSLALWLLALPFALKGTMAPGTVAMSAFATAYVYVGIEELGVQVEQPFELIPMTRICAIVTANVEEAFSAPPDTK